MTFPRSNQWFPVRLVWQEGQPLVEWCNLARHRFTEPFFADTVAHCLRLPFNTLFRRQTRIDALLDWQRRQPGLTPTGFIFHMSRCGSTLAAQMLAASRRNVVLSEPSPVDQVLRAPVAVAQKIGWLQPLVSALGQRRRAEEQRLFIKFDCWHTLDLPVVRAAFPTTPWIFLYRDPIEVLASQLHQRGEFMDPSPAQRALFEIEPDPAGELPPEEHCARVLARILQGVIEFGARGGLLVNYRDLCDAMETSVAAHFGLTWSPEELTAMRRVKQFDAKNPSFYFAADSEAKQRLATANIREISSRWLQPLYNQLEQQRECQPAVTCP